MKRLTYLLLAAGLLAACESREPGQPGNAAFPLESFTLSAGSSYYHGNIDQTEGSVSIGVIRYGAEVDGVSYELADGAVIAPDPQSFVGAWPETQDFTVTLNGKETVYTVTLTAYEGLSPEPEDPDDPDNPMPPAGEVLYYEDFDQTSSIPDEKYWGLCSADGSAWSKYMSESYDQAFVENGVLVLQSEKVDGKYKAGGIEMMNKFSFKHARVEVNARFKTAQGAWPAIWLMPQKQPAVYQGWPNGGEVDIMEQISNETVVYQTVHSHYTYDLGIKDPPTTVTPSYKVGEFNTYAVDMTPDKLIFYVNGQVTLEYPNLHLEDEATMKQWPFDGEFYLILNVALGGDGTWPGAIDDTQLPARMEVAWVRISDLGY